MSTKSDRFSIHFRYLFLAFLYLAVTLTTLNTFMDRVGFRGDNPRFGFRQMMEYRAEKPFCYRALVPLLVNGTYELFPESFIEKIGDDLTENSGLLRYVRIEDNFDAELSAKYHIAYFYMFLILLAIMIAIRKLTLTVYNEKIILADLAPAVAMIFLPMNLQHGGYIYDFLEILFFLAGLVFLLKRKMISYYLIFPLAVLNKGIGVFLILYYIIVFFEQKSSWKFRINVLFQLLVGAGVVIAVRIIFANNPDPALDYRLWTNLLFWLNPSSYVRMYEIYVPVIEIPTGANVLFLALVIYMILYRLKEKRFLIRRLFFWPLIVIVPLFLVFGNRDEFRVMSPVFPGLYLLAFGTITQIYSRLNKKDPNPIGFGS